MNKLSSKNPDCSRLIINQSEIFLDPNFYNLLQNASQHMRVEMLREIYLCCTPNLKTFEYLCRKYGQMVT